MTEDKTPGVKRVDRLPLRLDPCSRRESPSTLLLDPRVSHLGSTEPFRRTDVSKDSKVCGGPCQTLKIKNQKQTLPLRTRRRNKSKVLRPFPPRRVHKRPSSSPSTLGTPSTITVLRSTRTKSLPASLSFYDILPRG